MGGGRVSIMERVREKKKKKEEEEEEEEAEEGAVVLILRTRLQLLTLSRPRVY